MRTWLSFLLLLAGCATPRPDPAAEARERAQGDAAKTRYWQLQAAQQPRPTPTP